jgi:starch synthase
MKIAICVSEVVPFAKTGGLADVAASLPVALQKQGHEAVIIMPGYQQIEAKKFKVKRLKGNVSYCFTKDNIRVYFIESQEYFNRKGLYQDEFGDYRDNLERFAFYCRRALSLLKEVNFPCDIIHLHDWQASLIPAYLKSIYSKDKFYSNMRTVLTIHNIGYQGIFPKEKFPKLNLGWEMFNIEGFEFYDNINLLKGGIAFSDIINTVSPNHAKEITTPEFGFGLEGLLNKRSRYLYGILNGLDYDIWDPQKDKHIAYNYSLFKPENKRLNKIALQRDCGLPILEDAPLFGIVSRLVEQKGFDILLEAIEDICKTGSQLVILGRGDAKYENLLKRYMERFPDNLSFNIGFDEPLAHKIYAGSDFFLMPSKYEPCGLGQMIALRYGAIPVVYKTGGLVDTVNSKNGFLFSSHNKDNLLRAIKKAVSLFTNKDKLKAVILSAMKYDFSWHKTIKEYIKLYEKARVK